MSILGKTAGSIHMTGQCFNDQLNTILVANTLYWLGLFAYFTELFQ